MNIAQLLANAARSFPQSPAISVGDRMVVDYRQFGHRAACLATTLRKSANPAACVALAMPNCVEYLEILFAIWHAGLAAAPLNAKLSAVELAFMIDDCKAQTAFVSEEQAAELQSLLPGVQLVVPGSTDYRKMLAQDAGSMADTHWNNLAWVFYTSGTTGKPKGAMLSHGNLISMALTYFADVDFLDARDTLLHLAATSHASGLFGLSFVAKGANNVLPESGGFDPDELAALINRYDSLSFFVPPTLLRRIGRHDGIAAAQLDHVKTVLLGAAPVSMSDLQEGSALFGPKLWNGYGQGETPCTISAMSKAMIADALADGDEARLTSVGIARTGITIAIVDDNGNALPHGTVGEVTVHGATVMQGYLNRPEASADTLRNGWLYTGDLGRVDDRGYLTLLDRKKDLIISGGMNIYAREIEDVLLEETGVLEAAVIGVPDAEWGESVMALIVPAPGARLDAAMLDALCLSRIARFKRPKHYAFVDALPKNSSGKVLKRELRAQQARLA